MADTLIDMTQTLSQIKTLLADHGLSPKHRLGQNFLHDHNKMRQIVEAAQLSADELVLEVGPGTGGLSQQLLEAGVRLVAVEADTDLKPILIQQLAAWPGKFELIVGDVLQSKHQLNPDAIKALCRAGSEKEYKSDVPGFKLVANLPYNVASPVLANLVTDYPSMQLAVVTIQREVADRLLAEPGGKQYGPLGVLIQAMCRVEKIAILGPGCFWPAPKVDSAAVRLVRRADPLTDDPHRLSRLLHQVFSQRRKQLGSILGRDFPWPRGIDPQWRPENLTVAKLVQLAALFDDPDREAGGG